MPLERKVTGEFKLLQPKLQLFIFADAPDKEKLKRDLRALAKMPADWKYTIQPDSFQGTGTNKYSPPFNTRIAMEIPAGKDPALYKSTLEAAVNSVLAKIPGRCAVWSGSSELYKR